jgi:hypothetical protein
MTAPASTENLKFATLPNAPVATIMSLKSEALWLDLGWAKTTEDNNLGDAATAALKWIDVTNATLSGAAAEILAQSEALWDTKDWVASNPSVPATGATAGTPGTFTPAGATHPANLAAMTGLTASPATAWTTGQSVKPADNSDAHWTGTAWAAGLAP